MLIALAGFGLVASARVAAAELFPDREIYEPYAASPRTVQMKLGYIRVNESDIPGTSGDRWDLRLGERFGIYRWNDTWQFSLYGGFNALFDVSNNWDNIGWDGRYGATLAHQLTHEQSLKLELRHQSAHVGDELIERTGRTRIDYTRQELNLGYSNAGLSPIRLYAEAGWGWDIRNEAVQEPWRVQSGLEYRIRPMGHGNGEPRSGPFLAMDLGAMEEHDWDVDANLEAGWSYLKGNRLWKFGLEYRDGRVPLGEFSRSEERYIGIFIGRLPL